MPGAPVGEYAVIQSRTRFTNQLVIETVVLTRESDGQWRVSGYFHAEDNTAPTPPSAVPVGKNLITDPSLEDSSVGKDFPSGWGGHNAEPFDGYRYELIEAGRTGKHGWMIEGEGTYITVPTNRVPIVSGKRYVGRGWVKLTGSGKAQVRLLYFDKSRTYIGETRVDHVTASDQWRQVSITDRIADFPETHFVALAMSIIGNGKAVFDDLELQAVEPESMKQR
jgi:hypothetical protein